MINVCTYLFSSYFFSGTGLVGSQKFREDGKKCHSAVLGKFCGNSHKTHVIILYSFSLYTALITGINIKYNISQIKCTHVIRKYKILK